MNTRRIALALTLIGLVAAAAPADPPAKPLEDFPKLSAASDWPWWRGPTRDGVAPDAATAPPVKWGAAENVIWKARVPGRGHSSPVVAGDRVFLTTADEAKQVQSVLAYDRRTGQQLWKTDVNQGGFPAKINPKNSHASPTAACDGERLFALFFHHKSVQLTALTLDGKPAWQVKVGDFDYKKYEHGFAASPVVYKGTVIVSAESEGSSFLAALDRATGREVWRTPRPANTSYSTPAVGVVAGREQLLLSGANQVCAYDPATGKPLWAAPGTTEVTAGTAVWDGDVVLASGGFPKAETIAVRADGSGGTVLWKNKQQCYEPSMLAYRGHAYALTDAGWAYCWRAADGREMWKHRLRGPVSASPVLAGGHVYCVGGKGTTFVFKATPERFELVAENELGEESLATPAVSGGRLFLRAASRGDAGREETLYCIGATK